MSHSTLTQRKIAPTLCLLTLLSGVLACSLPGQAQPAALPAEALAATEAAIALTARAGVPTSMVSPPLPATFPPSIGVPAETPCQPTVTANIDVNVRSGPGPVYNKVGSLRAGESARVVGQDDFKIWWYIEYSTAPGGHGWVWGEGVTAACIPQGLQVVAAPPTPMSLTPTRTPTPTHTPIAKSDLEITNIGPVSTTRADKVFVDLKNNGPSEFSGNIRVVCAGIGYMRADPTQMVPIGSDESINITIGVGTGSFYPSMIINVPVYFYSPIQCVIEVPDNRDPNPNNNSYSIAIP